MTTRRRDKVEPHKALQCGLNFGLCTERFDGFGAIKR
jgi:hypothetical protein